MTRSIAIEKTADVLKAVLSEKCSQEIGIYAIQHLAMKSGVEFKTLIDSAEILLKSEILDSYANNK